MSIAIFTLPPPNFARTVGLSSSAIRSREVSASNLDTSSATASSKVSLSAAAEQAAKDDLSARLKLPDAGPWMRKDFPDDILAEAKTRLAERQAAPGIGDGYLPNNISNLPLLPENQALLDWLARSPHARFAHPSPEHFLPLFVALGAAGAQHATEWLAGGWVAEVLAADNYRFTAA